MRNLFHFAEEKMFIAFLFQAICPTIKANMYNGKYIKKSTEKIRLNH